MASVSVRPLADDNAQLNGLNLAPLIANGSRFSSSSASCGLSASMVDSSATGGSGSWRLEAIWTEKRGMASIFTSRRPDGKKAMRERAATARSRARSIRWPSF